jgi:hypothetical protein
MAKTLRTSGDYTVKAGAGYDSGSGTNTIRLDARYVRVPGDLVIEGTQTTIDSQTLTIEDQFIEVNRNNSTAGTEDSGIFFNQGSSNNQIIFYDADQSEFVVGSTTHDATVSAITNITPGKIRILTGTETDQAATKGYVDAQVSGGGYSLFFNGDDSTSITASAGTTVYFSGGDNITTSATEEPDQLNINLNRDLQGIDSISTDRSNQDLTLTANGTGSVVIEDVLTFSGVASTPTATTVTKLYNKTAAGGGTGLYFINSNISSGTEGELISKKKATALAIALG